MKQNTAPRINQATIQGRVVGIGFADPNHPSTGYIAVFHVADLYKDYAEDCLIDVLMTFEAGQTVNLHDEIVAAGRLLFEPRQIRLLAESIQHLYAHIHSQPHPDASKD